MALIDRTVPGMKERGFGRILNVSSSAVREPIPVLMLSNAHRSGLLAAFKTLARDLAGDGITREHRAARAGSRPTAWRTRRARSRARRRPRRSRCPPGRLGTVEEFAAVAAFLCSEQASYVTGTAVRVDGGLTQSI